MHEFLKKASRSGLLSSVEGKAQERSRVLSEIPMALRASYWRN
jgi:hypothetical protein